MIEITGNENVKIVYRA